MKAGFAYVWEFRIKSEAEKAFLDAYGPEGKWARLFSLSDGYIRTELLQDEGQPERFLTIDHWKSRADRDAFRKKYALEFAALDEECESMTEVETLIGEFEFRVR